MDLKRDIERNLTAPEEGNVMPETDWRDVTTSCSNVGSHQKLETERDSFSPRAFKGTAAG